MQIKNKVISELHMRVVSTGGERVRERGSCGVANYGGGNMTVLCDVSITLLNSSYCIFWVRSATVHRSVL